MHLRIRAEHGVRSVPFGGQRLDVMERMKQRGKEVMEKRKGSFFGPLWEGGSKLGAKTKVKEEET